MDSYCSWSILRVVYFYHRIIYCGQYQKPVYCNSTTDRPIQTQPRQPSNNKKARNAFNYLYQKEQKTQLEINQSIRTVFHCKHARKRPKLACREPVSIQPAEPA